MNESVRDLLVEYCGSLEAIRRAIRRAASEADRQALCAMERDLQWAIEYMATGYLPARSIGCYRRVVPVDPQRVLLCFTAAVAPASSLSATERARQKMLPVLDMLSVQERQAYLSVVGEGISYRQAARMMGISRASVQMYVSRAKVKIARRVVRSTHIDGETVREHKNGAQTTRTAPKVNQPSA